MLDNMAPLRQAMEEMDAQDPAVSLAAKDRAAQILKDNDLNFTKMAELIEQRRLLLRPKILASMKRMDHEMLGEVSFRETGNALRREGQSFRQVADALELNRGLAPQHEDSLHTSEPSHEMAIEPGRRAPLRAASGLTSIFFFPLRHPFWFFVIAFAAVGLIYIVSSLAVTDRPRGGTQAVASATPSCPIPPCSASPSATPSATSSATIAGTPPTTTPTPSANAPTSLPPTASTCPPTSTSSRDASGASSSTSSRDARGASSSTSSRDTSGASSSTSSRDTSGASSSTSSRDAHGASSSTSSRDAYGASSSTSSRDAYGASSSTSTVNDCTQRMSAPRFGSLIPDRYRRNSISAGQCVSGVGGCRWGGGHF
jgi:hypothetical protein